MVRVRCLVLKIAVIGSEIYYVNDICPHKYGRTNVCPSYK